ncbi:hypothetical protein Tco_0475908 [Tanacetum coccineum]
MDICTKLSERVLDLEKIKDAQALDIQKLKTRVKKLEKKKKSRTLQLKRRLFKVRIESSIEKSLETQGRYGHDIDVTTTSEPITTAEPSTPPTTKTVIEYEDLTIAQILMKMKSEKSKEKAKERGSKEKSSESASRPTRGVIMQEPSEASARSILPPQQQIDPKDKGKAKMIEPEKPLKKNDQIAFDEEIARRLEADFELAQRLQAEEQGEITIEERSKLFVEIMNKRKQHFAKLRAEEIRRKPPTKAQKRNQMSTYLKNMEVVEGSKNQAKGSKKRIRKELDEESVKRQKLDDDAKKAELKACLEIVPRDDEAVNVESLATKYPIFDWKTHILAKDKMYYEIIRAGGSTKLVKERFKTTSPEGYDRFLWGDLITLFKPSEEDEI